MDTRVGLASFGPENDRTTLGSRIVTVNPQTRYGILDHRPVGDVR